MRLAGKSVCLAVCCLAHVAGAWADAGDVFNVTVSQNVARDDNLFRLPDGREPPTGGGSQSRADTISRTGVTLTADKAVGRQRLHAGADAMRVRYDRHSQLDGELSGYSAGWDWVLGRLWTGTLSHARTQVIPGFSDYSTPVRDIVTTETTNARAVFGFHPDWRFSLGGGAMESSHSASVNAFGDQRTNSFEMGVSHVSGLGKTIGLRIRRADVEYMNRQTFGMTPADSGYRESGAYLDVNWPLGASGQLTGSLGQTRTERNNLPGRDFDGATGRLNVTWRPTEKTDLGLGVSRVTNTEGTAAAEDVLLSTLTVTESVNVQAGWRPTRKLALRATAEARRRDQRGEDIFPPFGASDRRDDDRTYGLNLDYAASSALRLGLAVSDQRRDASPATFSYRTRQVSFSASFVF